MTISKTSIEASMNPIITYTNLHEDTYRIKQQTDSISYGIQSKENFNVTFKQIFSFIPSDTM